MATAISEKTRDKFLEKVVSVYSAGKLSVGRASEILGISRAEFYEVLEDSFTEKAR